jgi:hypothetical protein
MGATWNSSLPCGFFVRAHRGGIGIHFGAEVAQDDQRFGFAVVLIGHAGFGGVFGAEVFVLSEFGEADEFWAVESVSVDLADALDADEAVSAVVFDGASGSGFDGEFFGAEELFASDLPINDPAIEVAFLLGVRDGNGFEIMVVFEFGIDVAIPIELFDDPIEVAMFALGHVFDEERPGNFAAFDEGLIHSKNVAAPLRFVGAKGTGRVKDARRNQPAGAGFEAVGAREIEDAVVAFVPVFEAAPDLGFGGAGFEAHEGVGEIVADVVVLRRKVIGLGFAFLADEFGLFGILMHVVRNGSHVIEELGIDGPLFVFLPNFLADDGCAAFSNRLAQGEALFAGNDVAEAFVGRAVFVGGGSGGSKPAFVDAAAIETEGIEIVRMKFEAFAGLEERARDPARRKSKQTSGVLQSAFDEAFDVLSDGSQCSNLIHAGRVLGGCELNLKSFLLGEMPRGMGGKYPTAGLFH